MSMANQRSFPCWPLCRWWACATPAITARPKRLCSWRVRQAMATAPTQHHAGCLLLAKCLQRGMPGGGNDRAPERLAPGSAGLDGADAIVVFADGGGGNPINAHLEQVDALIKKGVGLVCLHYAVQVDDPRARACFKDWIGGHLRNPLVGQPHLEG